MNVPELIVLKRDGGRLSDEEMRALVKSYTVGAVPDYQMAAFLMAVYFRGLSRGEVISLTNAMATSGKTLDIRDEFPVVADKHSTGGVGDKLSLVALPIAAACGLPIGKMSGRGLSFSGGTIDKLESIPGFRAALSPDEFRRNLGEVGLVIASQSASLAPADAKLYALRDVTGTVDSVPLIAASIMSKKIAGGSNVLLLDIKVGSGAFMRSPEQARELATLMLEIASRNEIRCSAIISDMNQPLGWAVGNALELKEAICTLRGDGPADLLGLSLDVAARLLVLAGIEPDYTRAAARCRGAHENGDGLAKLIEFVRAQSGDTAVVNDPSRLPSARLQLPVVAQEAGYIKGIGARTIGEASVLLGAGRTVKGATVDHAVGIELHKKVGDELCAMERIATVHANNNGLGEMAAQMVFDALEVSSNPVQTPSMLHEVVDQPELQNCSFS